MGYVLTEDNIPYWNGFMEMEETLYLCGYVLTEDNTPNCNGFMEMSTWQEKDYQVSKVLIQPFLNL